MLNAKEVFAKTLNFIRKQRRLPEEKELNKQLGRKIRIKFRGFICREKHIQKLVFLAVTLLQRMCSKLPSLISRLKLQKFGFSGLSKNFFSPLNLFALLLMDIGAAILIWMVNLLWTDLTYWGKDVGLILFGSRTGEAISLGLGMTMFYYMTIGAALLVTSITLIKGQKIREYFFVGISKREKIHNLLSSASIKSRKMRGLNLGRILKKGKMIAALTLLGFFVINMFLLSSIVGQTSTKTSLQSYGSIRTVGVGVYTNGYCTTTVSTVDWGQITPGQDISRTFYLRNEGSSDVTLTMFATNWTPSAAENYMTVDWDYAGQTLSPNQVIAVTFTLSVQSTISGIETFNFNIDIIGSG